MRWTIELYFQKSQTQCLLYFRDFHFAGDMYASPTCGLHGASEAIMEEGTGSTCPTRPLGGGRV